MSNNTKTIFITSFHSLLSRVLGGGILDELLLDKDIRIVIFTFDFKKDYYVKEFASSRVIIETIKPEDTPKGSLFFRSMSFMLLHTKTMSINIHSGAKKNGRYYQVILYEALSFLGGFKLARSLFRSISLYFSEAKYFSKYFEKYKPKLVFSTDVKHILDTQMMIEAQKRKIKTVGMVRSWDNLTAKGILRALPDKLVVHNETLKKEATRFNDIKEENIFISGIPHYDMSINSERSGREEFFKKIGADIEKRLILFAPIGDHYSDTDWHIVKILKEAIENNEIPSDLQILLRFPPGDTVYLDKLTLGNVFLCDQPGLGFKDRGIKDNEMTVVDCICLADSIFHSEIVIAGPSTVLVDGAAFGNPLIAINFDGFDDKNYYNSIKRYYDFCHLSNLVRTGGVKMSNSKQDLISSVNQYLDNPDIDKAGRERIISEQCYKLDGKSSQRIAGLIFDTINTN